MHTHCHLLHITEFYCTFYFLATGKGSKVKMQLFQIILNIVKRETDKEILNEIKEISKENFLCLFLSGCIDEIGCDPWLHDMQGYMASIANILVNRDQSHHRAG